MVNLKGKKLLILGGAAIHKKLADAANALGVHTIVADYLEDSPAKRVAAESWLVSITDIDTLERLCRENNVDGVLNMCIDPAQRPYCELCERLGLPCFGTAEQFFIMTDKHAFKDFCAKNGIDTIPEYTEQQLLEGQVEFPVMIKPVDSRGSRGQTVLYDACGIKEGLALAKAESSNGEVIIERFMEGKQDFSMTYFTVDGKPYLTRVCDRYLGKAEDNLNKQCVGCIAPSKYTDLYLKNVHERMVSFIKTLGIKYGPLFMQGFVDGDTVRFYDPGLRFPGGEYELMLRDITGADFMSLLVEFALTGKITHTDSLKNDLYSLGGHHTIQLPITARAGKITTFKGREEIENNPFVTTTIRRYEVGEEVPDTGDVRQRIYEVAMDIDGSITVKEAVRFVHSALTVLDENGEDMLVSLVDSNILNYSN